MIAPITPVGYQSVPLLGRNVNYFTVFTPVTVEKLTFLLCGVPGVSVDKDELQLSSDPMGLWPPGTPGNYHTTVALATIDCEPHLPSDEVQL